MINNSLREKEKISARSSGVEWAWAVIIFVTIFSNLMFDGQGFAYALGHTLAGIVAGFIFSPIVFLIIKKLIKPRWMWYHWFNIATCTGIGMDILRWTIVPVARNLI